MATTRLRCTSFLGEGDIDARCPGVVVKSGLELRVASALPAASELLKLEAGAPSPISLNLTFWVLLRSLTLLKNDDQITVAP